MTENTHERLAVIIILAGLATLAGLSAHAADQKPVARPPVTRPIPVARPQPQIPQPPALQGQLNVCQQEVQYLQQQRDMAESAVFQCRASQSSTGRGQAR